VVKAMNQDLFNTLQIIFALGPTRFLIALLFFGRGDRAIQILRARVTLVWLSIFCGVEILLYLAHATLFFKILAAVIATFVWIILMLFLWGGFAGHLLT
jgi:hypothetical protein